MENNSRITRMKLLIGLGNPEKKYDKTRHNLGFAVLDEYVRKLDNSVQRLASSWRYEEKFKAEILKFNYTLNANNYPLILVKPQTYMNNSGLAVSALANFYKIKPEDIIVIHDDLDLPLGKIKVRLGGSSGGHHGVESIISALGRDQFIRVRGGIGNLRSGSGERGGQTFNAEHFVLESFMPGDRPKVKHMIKAMFQALDLLLEKGLEETQNQFN